MALFGSIGSAHATLTGDNLDFMSSVGNLADIDVVIGQVEFNAFGGGLRDCDTTPSLCVPNPTPPPDFVPGVVTRIDLEDVFIEMELGEVTSGFFLSFFDIRDPLSNVTLDFSGAGSAILSFTSSSIDVRSFSNFSPSIVTLNLTFAPPGTAPEPSTLLLLGAGLVGLWARRRRH
jgi:hypothetical protein